MIRFLVMIFILGAIGTAGVLVGMERLEQSLRRMYTERERTEREEGEGGESKDRLQ